AHHLAEAPADREAESRAAVLARGRRIGLHELLEQPPHLLGRHADSAVADCDRDPVPSVLARALRSDRDASALGELARVARKIQQGLSHSRRIGMHLAKIGGTVRHYSIVVLR